MLWVHKKIRLMTIWRVIKYGIMMGFLASLGACGQKGALYLPAQTVNSNHTTIIADPSSQAY